MVWCVGSGRSGPSLQGYATQWTLRRANGSASCQAEPWPGTADHRCVACRSRSACSARPCGWTPGPPHRAAGQCVRGEPACPLLAAAHLRSIGCPMGHSRTRTRVRWRGKLHPSLAGLLPLKPGPNITRSDSSISTSRPIRKNTPTSSSQTTPRGRERDGAPYGRAHRLHSFPVVTRRFRPTSQATSESLVPQGIQADPSIHAAPPDESAQR